MASEPKSAVRDSTHELMGRAAPDARDIGADRLRAALRAKLLDVDDRVLVGRYEIGPRLGAGGMGVVHRGWDPKLERDVAIKLVPLGDAPPETVLREARAMASVTHRNVVPVYDVGRRAAEAYVVMALMEGGTIADWIERTPRQPRTVVAKLVEAGWGLAAGHRAGVVHHDFKPSNVLLASDGCACVSDFGLASVLRNVQSMSTIGDEEDSEGSLGGGTRGYCAPERIEGRSGDARSDQYSFCVSLAVVLARYVGMDPRPEAASEVGAKLASAPPGELSPHVGRALLRGLSARPADRFDSMDALLEALSLRRRRVAPRLALGAVAVLVASVAVVGLGSTRWSAAPSVSPSAALSSVVDGASEDDAVRALLRASKAARLGDVLVEAERFGRLAWSLGATDDRTRAEIDLELGLTALELTRKEEAHRRIVDALARAERAQWHQGIASAHIAMIRMLPDGPDQSSSAREHERFVRAALDRLGRDAPSAELELALSLFNVELAAGNIDRAEQIAEAAAAVGIEHDLRGRYWAFFDRCRIAIARRRYEQARQWCEQALDVGLSVRASARDLLLVRGNLSQVATLQGQLSAAREQGEAMMPLFVSSYGAHGKRTAEGLFNLAMLREGTGDVDGAIELYERAIEILRGWHPDESMLLARSYGGLAQAKSREDLAEAERWYSKALVELESAGLADDVNTVKWRAQLGGIELARGRTDIARRHLDAAIEAAARLGDQARPGLAMALAYRGRINLEQGELEPARVDLLAAIDAGLGSLESLHPDQVWEARVLAEVEEARGDHAAAREILERVLAALERAGLKDDPSWAESAVHLARVKALEENESTEGIAAHDPN